MNEYQADQLAALSGAGLMTFRTWLAEAVSRLKYSDSPKRDANPADVCHRPHPQLHYYLLMKPRSAGMNSSVLKRCLSARSRASRWRISPVCVSSGRCRWCLPPHLFRVGHRMSGGSGAGIVTGSILRYSGSRYRHRCDCAGSGLLNGRIRCCLSGFV